jgi:hypothetical protein
MNDMNDMNDKDINNEQSTDDKDNPDEFMLRNYMNTSKWYPQLKDFELFKNKETITQKIDYLDKKLLII